jgi:cytochrome P450
MVVLAKPSIMGFTLLVPIFQLITNPVSSLTHIHAKYGDQVFVNFFNSKLLFICNPEHIAEVYGLEGKGLVSRDFMYEAKKLLFGDGLVNSKSGLWTKQRRLMHPLFTSEAIAVWGQHIVAEADGLANKLKKSTIPEVNLSSELKVLIQRIFIRVLFGKSADTMEDADILIDSMAAITNGLAPHLVTETIGKGKLKLLFPFHAWRLRKAINRLTFFVHKEIHDKNDSPSHDLISLLMQARDKRTGYAMTKELLKDEAVNLFFAGQDTTINTLSWFFYLIGKHQSIHDKITEEIKKHGDDQLTQENLTKLVYTKAALYETLRLYPPTTALATQAVEDVMIGERSVNKGTTIIISMYAAHRDKTLWERPDEFYPEHFINQAAPERHKYAFFPFGGGLHNCIGKHFAELEMMVIIVTLLREFTVITHADIKEAFSITLKPNIDVMVTLIPLNT